MKKIFVFLILVIFIGIYAVPALAAIQYNEPVIGMELDKDQKTKPDKDGKATKAKTKANSTECGHKATGCEGKTEMKKENCRGHKEAVETKVAAVKPKESKEKK